MTKARYDEDSPEWTEERFARSRPADEVLPEAVLALFGKKRGRPRVTAPKPSVTLRLDQETLDLWRGSGRGWQTRLGELARVHAPRQAQDGRTGPAEKRARNAATS